MASTIRHNHYYTNHFFTIINDLCKSYVIFTTKEGGRGFGFGGQPITATD